MKSIIKKATDAYLKEILEQSENEIQIHFQRNTIGDPESILNNLSTMKVLIPQSTKSYNNRSLNRLQICLKFFGASYLIKFNNSKTNATFIILLISYIKDDRFIEKFETFEAMMKFLFDKHVNVKKEKLKNLGIV